MKSLLRRIRRLADAHPEIEIGANIYFIHGQYRLGQIQKGKQYSVWVHDNSRICGQFHSHTWETEPSKGDYRTLASRLEIVVTPSKIYVGKFERIPKDWKDYICGFDIFL